MMVFDLIYSQDFQFKQKVRLKDINILKFYYIWYFYVYLFLKLSLTLLFKKYISWSLSFNKAFNFSISFDNCEYISLFCFN